LERDPKLSYGHYYRKNNRKLENNTNNYVFRRAPCKPFPKTRKQYMIWQQVRLYSIKHGPALVRTQKGAPESWPLAQHCNANFQNNGMVLTSWCVATAVLISGI
jgi:hypothetical protein